MLNKLNYYKRLYSGSPNTNLLGNDFYRETIARYYAEQLGLSVTLEPLCIGTLGIKFVCRSRLPYPLFLKTHELLDTDGREAIEREYECMRKINLGKMHIKLHVLNTGRCSLLLLEEEILHPLNTSNLMHKVQQEISCYQKACIDSSVCYDMNQLVTVAIEEEKMLKDAGLLSENLSAYMTYKLNELIEAMPSLPRCLCHGDLSDNNIMQNKNKQMIIVDWEDAFIGIDGYDYLYWLTFFNKRKYYSDRNIFLKVKFAVNILSVIMIIKSALSYYSGQYRRNRLSIEERIVEIFNAAGEYNN